MKKIVAVAIAGTMSIAAFTGLTSNAYALQYDPAQRALEIVLDGSKIPFQDARPIMDTNSRTLVPLRAVSENLGAKVKWDGKRKKALIQKENTRIEMKVNDSTAYINGEAIAFDSQMVMIGTNTFVPLRFVSEAFGTEVKFDKEAHYVYVKTPGVEKADVKLDEYGREIRTTNLPKNYKDYPYILKDIPNEMYEVPFYVETRSSGKPIKVSELSKQPHINRRNVDAWKKKIEEYFGLVLNVDYSTIDYKWAKQVRKDVNMLGSDDEMRTYVDWAKKNKIKVEGVLVAEPSIVYSDGDTYRMRVKYQFRITSFIEYKNLIYDMSFHLSKNDNGKLPTKYKKNMWYEGYADIALSTNVGGSHYTPDLMVSANPSLFLDNAVVREWKW
ncbi:copper amine oxidase N-terminal domain-containing protein [Paenibacillus apiarius]|uniref:copper amine oxidase N-terminal domain-containing protein n=1 Tax=Paenibacillus apiarius TaxID=46240 RepID=UPI003B3A1E27